MCTQKQIELELCNSTCKGKSCCNCCSKAPNLHPKNACTAKDVYEMNCCFETRWHTPGECMYLQGKTRQQWQNEFIKNMEENKK